jgi:uncharacterized protein (DUF2141 family)
MKPLQGVSRAAVLSALVFAVVEAAGSPVQDRQMIRVEATTTVAGQGAGAQVQSNVPMSPMQQNGSGLIVGQVVEAGSDRGVPGAIVTLGGALPGPPQVITAQFISRDGGPPMALNSSASSLPRLITDAEGRFAFRNVPKGVFNITATKPGYLDGAYGRMRPNGTVTPLELADDERAGDLKVRLFRAASISGTVLDDLNDPVVGIQIKAYRRNLVAGRRVLTPVAGSAMTDDRGVYRISNLIPGEYIVALQTMQSSVPASMQVDGPLMGDLLATMLSAGGGGSVSISNTGTQVTPDGKFMLQSNNGYAAVGPRGRTLVYPTQYYPTGNSVSQATPIVLVSGEERGGIDLNLKLVPTLNVAGRLMGPEGPAANFALHLVPSDTGDLSNDPDVATSITDANGDFQFLAVPAGQYVIQTVRIPRGGGVQERVALALNTGGSVAYTVNVQTNAAGQGAFFAAGAPASTTVQALWLATPISLSSADVTDMALTLRTGLKVAGRVEFDGMAERPPADRLSTVTVVAESADGKQKAPIPPTRLDGTGQFTLAGLLPGKYILRVTNVPGGWTFKGATTGGLDITDVPFDVEERDLTGVTVTFFDRPSELRGSVRSGAGTDAAAAVVIFPADTRSWTNYGVNPRRMRMSRAGKSGQFTFAALPAGDYFVAAINDEVAGEWQDPQFLDLLSRTATRVTVGEGQKLTQDLTTQNIRPGGGLMPPVDDVDGTVDQIGHGPFVSDADEPQRPTQGQTQSRDTRPQPQTPRDTATTPTGTASIAGVVTMDDPSAQPMRRTRVIARLSDGRVERQGTTDDAGKFSITGLPPGTYTLNASKPAYLAAYYGSKRPGRGPGVPIVLAAGQAFANVSLKMAKGGVVSGTIRDDYGLPIASANVRLMQFRTVNGERTLSGQQSAMTDDRGNYRIFGLTPATYVVSVTAPATLGQNEIRQLSNNDLQTAMLDLQRPAQPSAATSSETTAGTGGRGGQPPARPVGRTVGFAPVYYPGTLIQSEATPLSVTAGQELTGIDLPVRLVPTARIEGSVIGADGRPAANTSLNLVASEVGQTAVVSPKFVNSNAEGKFTFTNVAPGRYTLSARGGAMTGAIRFSGGGDFVMAVPAPVVGAVPAGALPPPPPPPPPPLAASTHYATADLEVNGENIADLTLTLQEAMTITGRVVFAGKTMSAPANLARTRLSLFPAVSGGVVIGVPDAIVDATGAFKITNVAPGRYRLSASIPGATTTGGGGAASGWALRSAVVDGRDVLDSPFEIRAGQSLQNMVVTFIDTPTEISGKLMDAAGKPMPGFAIVVFSTDRSTWSAGSRRISPPIQVATDGRYKATGLPPGEYFLAAITDYEQGDLGDVTFLDQIAAVAIKVTLGEGEKKVQDLKIGSLGH